MDELLMKIREEATEEEIDECQQNAVKLMYDGIIRTTKWNMYAFDQER